MKKIKILLACLITLVLLNACFLDNEKFSLITPSGTPSLALSSFLESTKTVDYEIASGTDPLVAAFTNKSKDIIVAPVNLGLKLYNSLNDFGYVFYKPLIGCNFVIKSSTEITSIADLEGKDIYLFGKNATPDIILRSVLNFHKIKANLIYQSDVTTTNALLVSGKANIIVTAEPSATKISQNKNFYTFLLSEAYAKITEKDYDVPQAGIFLKKDLLNDAKKLNIILKELDTKVEEGINNHEALAESAVNVDASLKALTKEVLIKAIPNCNILTLSTNVNKEEIAFYFNCILDLGLGSTIGNTLPDEKFYF